MTLVRRHLVAAVSLVLALAAGIALGAGPLSREALVPTRATAPAPAKPEPAGGSADDLATAVTPTLTRDRLAGRTVALVSTPGADPDAVAALASDVEGAGGAVAERWSLGRSLVAVGETALVDTLGEQLLEQLGGRPADAEAPPYERMGQLLGAALATRDARPQVPSDEAVTVRRSLDAAALLSAGSGEEAEDARQAPFVLVVLGRDVEDAIVEGLTTGLADRAQRVVVAAPTRTGDLAVLDDAGVVSTVDGSGGAAGRLAAVLALARPADEPVGSYGASGSDGVLPLG